MNYRIMRLSHVDNTILTDASEHFTGRNVILGTNSAKKLITNSYYTMVAKLEISWETELKHSPHYSNLPKPGVFFTSFE